MRETGLFLPTGGKKAYFGCSYCKRDITQQLRIQCAVCDHYDLCGDCFAAGAQRFPHENTHDYRVVDCIDIPLFSKDWTASEELLMLEGIDKCGCGNWKNVSEYIGTKNIKQVEEHYWENQKYLFPLVSGDLFTYRDQKCSLVYMGVHGYCLPARTILNDETVSTESLLAATRNENGEILVKNEFSNENEAYDETLKTDNIMMTKVMYGYERGDEVIRDKLRETGKNRDRQMQEIREKNALLPGGDLPGFIPLREDFDFEYENDAELLLADMEFSPDDHPSERELKLQVVRIYNSKLDDREKRKRFVIDRGLVDKREQIAQDKKRTKEERELVARLRIFARFHSVTDHEALVDGLIRARKLRQQIEIYQQYRKMGIRTLEQAKQYEVDRKRRDIELKVRKQRSETPYLFETGRERGGAVRTSTGGISLGSGSGSSSSSSSSSSSATGNGMNNGAGRRASGGRRNRPDEEDFDDCDVEVVTSGRLGRTIPKGATNINRPFSLDSDRDRERDDVEDNNTIIADILKAPGADLLSEKELQLCGAVPMLPMHYLTAKDAVVREAYRNGTLTSEGVRRVLKLDPNKMGKIADFFVREIAEAVPRVPINFQDKNTISGNGTAPPPTLSDKNNSSTSGSITATTNGRPGQPVRQGKVKGKTNKGGRPKRKLGEEGTLDPVDSEICDDEEDTMSYSNSSNIMDVEP